MSFGWGGVVSFFRHRQVRYSVSPRTEPSRVRRVGCQHVVMVWAVVCGDRSEGVVAVESVESKFRVSFYVRAGVCGPAERVLGSDGTPRRGWTRRLSGPVCGPSESARRECRVPGHVCVRTVDRVQGLHKK